MFYPNPAFNFENQSNMSEDRNISNIQKGVRSTNPTSETSSFKGSSVISNPDAQLSKSASRKENENNEVLRPAKSGKKNGNKKRGKDDKNKALKSSRPAYGSTSEHQDLREENKRSSSKSNPESESIWESDITDSVLSPNPQKKGGKVKKKDKNNKSPKISQSPDKKTDSKSKLQKSNESTDSKT